MDLFAIPYENNLKKSSLNSKISILQWPLHEIVFKKGVIYLGKMFL